jgi:hypothetical protein
MIYAIPERTLKNRRPAANLPLSRDPRHSRTKIMKTLRLLAVLTGVALLASTATAETKLVPKFQDGTSYKTKETIKTRQSLKLGGQSMDTAANTVIVSESKIGQRNAEGDLTVESTYTEVVSEITLPGGKKVTYNSTTGEGKSDDPNFEIVLEKLKGMKGMTFTAVLDKDNRVKDIRGIPADAGASPEEVKTAMQNNLDRYPAEAVNPGDTWKREMVVPLGQGQIFNIKRTYKYVGPETRSTVTSTMKLEKITATTDDISYSIGPNSAIPGQVTKSELKSTASETTIYYDPAKGRTIESRDKLHVTGAIALTIMGVELAGDLDLTMDVTSEDVP